MVSAGTLPLPNMLTRGSGWGNPDVTAAELVALLADDDQVVISPWY